MAEPPSSLLSSNEPSGVDEQTHATVVKLVADAIRAEDPDRLIICDGVGYGRGASLELLPLKVAQSTRGYSPFGLTHYKAGWATRLTSYSIVLSQ